MAVDPENADCIYETNAKGESEMVRSLESVHCVYIRFVNRTSRPVDVWWRNFEGRRVHYMRMAPRSYFHIDTYVTHPWEFTDPTTKENYLINNKMIFRPPHYLAGMQHRTNWVISICIRPLRSTAMLSIAQRIKYKSKVAELGLPRELQVDLERLVDALRHTPPPPPRA